MAKNPPGTTCSAVKDGGPEGLVACGAEAPNHGVTLHAPDGGSERKPLCDEHHAVLAERMNRA